MKKTTAMNSLPGLALALACATHTAPAAVLFADNFDRPDNNDIDASTAGMSGSVGPLSYIERGDLDASLGNDDGLTNIGNNRLNFADGPNASTLHLDHNFIGGSITADGGFRVGFDLAANNGTANEPARFLGFGVGMTAADVSSYGFDQGASAGNPGIRGASNGTVADSGLADWSIAITRTGSEPDTDLYVSIHQNGLETIEFTTFDSGAGISTNSAGSLTVEFALSSFDSGATVTPSISWGSETLGSSEDLSFAWDESDGNYIGLFGRQNGEGWAMDNLSIDTIPEPASALLGSLGMLMLVRRRR